MLQVCYRHLFKIISVMLIVFYLLSLKANKTCYNNETMCVKKKKIDMKSLRNVNKTDVIVKKDRKDETHIDTKNRKKCGFFGIPNITQNYRGSFHFFQDRNIYTYSAYLDTRIPSQRYVKIMGFSPVLLHTFYCQMYYKDGSVVSTVGKPDGRNYEYRKPKMRYPYLSLNYICKEPLGFNPNFVSLTAVECIQNVTNMHKVDVRGPLDDKRIPNYMLVCSKTLYNYTSSYKLIEFLEFQRLMGVNKVVFYDYDNVSTEVINIIHHYTKTNFVLTLPWKLPLRTYRRLHKGVQLKTHGQQTQYNDCIYRYMNQYKYIAIIDTDEFIIPRNISVRNYKELLDNFDKNITSFVFARTHFCMTQKEAGSNDPRLLTTSVLKRGRPESYTKAGRPKSIVNPRLVSVMSTHLVYTPLYTDFKIKNIPENVAVMHHYRGGKTICHTYDNTASKYGEQLLQNTNQVCLKLNMTTL